MAEKTKVQERDVQDDQEVPEGAEDFAPAFGMAEDPPTNDPKESHDESVVTDEEVAKATGTNPVTGARDPSALSRDDDITVEPEHWAEGHYWSDTTGLDERTQRVPEDNFVTEREADGSPVDRDDNPPPPEGLEPPPDVPMVEPPPDQPPGQSPPNPDEEPPPDNG